MTENPPDFSFVPETYHGEDGAIDTAQFRADFDDLTTFRAQETERLAALPQEATGYEFTLGEDFQVPEGFELPPAVDAEGNAVLDDDGNPKTITAQELLNTDDPDIAAAQALLLEAKADPSLAGKLAGLMVNREIRQMQKDAEHIAAQRSELGPDVKSREATMKRALEVRLGKQEADAVFDGISSATAFRAVEKLLAKQASPVPPTPKPAADFENMTPRQMMEYGINQMARN